MNTGDEPGGTPIELRFRYCREDFARAMRAHYGSRNRLLLDIAVAALVGAGGVLLWRSESHWLGGAFISASLFFALLLVAGLGIIPYVVFRSQAKFRDEYQLTFLEDGILFRTAQIDSELKWEIYSKALIDCHSFVLYYGARSYTIIPKRVFHSEAQREAFEQLLLRKIRNVVSRS